MTVPIRGLLFDKDGTLLDYDATWGPANRTAALTLAEGDGALAERLLVAGGYRPESGTYAPNSVMAAGTNAEIAALWQPYLPAQPVDRLTARLEAVLLRESRAHSAAVPALAPSLKALKGAGYTLGVATSDSHEGIAATLAPFDVLDLFDFVAGYDSGHGGKPGAGMVHAFCAVTGLHVREVAVIGDNLHDMEMARRAGAGLRIAVLTGTGDRASLLEAADHVIDGIAQLEDLLRSRPPPAPKA